MIDNSQLITRKKPPFLVKRQKFIFVMTDAEMNLLEDKAEQLGISKAEVIRSCFLSFFGDEIDEQEEIDYYLKQEKELKEKTKKFNRLAVIEKTS